MGFIHIILGYYGGTEAAAPSIQVGCTVAMAIYVPGAAASEVYQPGAVASQIGCR